MSTNYPTSLDVYGDVPVNQNTNVKHRDRHQNVEDSIEAVQAYLGSSSSSVPASLFAGLRFGSAPSPARGGFFTDDDPNTKIFRTRDRWFFGDGSLYTGRRTAPYGGDWLTDFGASYFIKNSQVAVLGDESEKRYGFLAAARGGGIGGAFVILNEDGAAGRAIYAEAMHKSNGMASASIETATTNYTATDTNPNAYTMTGARGIYLAAFDGAGYTVGDANTPVPLATLPPAAAVDIAGYSTTATRWRKGIVFRNGSLYRGTGDGSAGEAVAVDMAAGHAVVWEASSTIRGAVIRSDVTAVASQDVGIVFANNVVQIVGTTEFPMMEFVRDSAGAGAVNNAKFTNARTGISPKLSAQGTDANVGLEFQAKAAGVIRFLGQGGAAESLRVQFNNSYVNFLTATGGLTTAPVVIGAGGSDTNISTSVAGKGTGNAQLTDSAGVVKVAANSTGLGFFGATPAAKPSITGARGGNAALASLLTQGATLGLWTDSTTA